MQNSKNESSFHKNQQYWASPGFPVAPEGPPVAAGWGCEGSAVRWCGRWHRGLAISVHSSTAFLRGAGPSAENAAVSLQKNHIQ